jgi:hypothetical protein
MSIKTITTFLLFGLSFVCTAQITPRLFEFGPKLGVQITGLANLDTTTLEKKVAFGYQGGIFTRFNYKKFSIQPEFIYQVKGGTVEEPQAKYSYKYFSTPVLLGYAPVKGIYFETGPELSWAVNKDFKPEALTVYGPNVARDMGWVIGTRINMLDLFSLASLNIRYTHGFDNQTTAKKGNTPLDLRNRSVQVSFSYTFSEYYLWKKKYGVKKRK